jgi:O-6-methylguanine DNA methyltransferase
VFKQKVLKLVSQIPKGRVSTYKEIAKKAGKPKAYRAVGNILKMNHKSQVADCKFPIVNVPCHRIIKTDGSLGGYAAGIKKKKLLLQKEGVKIENNKIDLSKYLYKI